MFAEDAAAGEAEIAAAARHRLRAVRPDLADCLPPDAAGALANPLVLGALMGAGDPGVTLDQLLVGQVPGGTEWETVSVRTDLEGVADLPGLGLLRTDRRLAELSLGRGVRVTEAGRHVSATLDEPLHSGHAGSPLLDCTVAPPLRFVLGKGLADRLGVAPAGAAAGMSRALELLERVQPEFSSLFLRTTRRIVCFDDPQLNSLAAPRAQGAIFLDLAHGEGAIYHLEDLLHQGGHVAFQTMTMDPANVLDVDPDTPIGDDSDPEPRTAYVLLHAVVTERWMTAGLLGCLEQDLVAGIEQVEARGRLAYILRRYLLDLVDLVDAAVTSARGTDLVRLLYGDFRTLSARAERYVAGLDLTGQPYNFNLGVLVEQNPGLLERVGT